MEVIFPIIVFILIMRFFISMAKKQAPRRPIFKDMPDGGAPSSESFPHHPGSGDVQSDRSGPSNQGRSAGRVNTSPEKDSLEDLLRQLRAGKSKSGARASSRGKKTVQPFLRREIDQANRSHYSEEDLKRRFVKQHSQGKPLKHHVHDLNADFSSYGKKEKRKKPSPYRLKLKNRNNLKEAFILQEILTRKF